MSDYPKPIWDYICLRALGKQPSSYLLTDAEGRIQEWGGDMDFLQRQSFNKGDFISDIFDFMHGILPLETEMLLLPDLSIQPKRVFDAHVFQTIGGFGLVLVDKGTENRRRVSLQQFTNTIELEKITHFAKPVSDGVENSDCLSIETLSRDEGDQAMAMVKVFIAVLAVDIQSINRKIVSETITGVSKTLLPCLKILADAIFEHNGYIETLIGDRLVALFGISPIKGAPASEALTSAVRIMRSSFLGPPSGTNKTSPPACRIGVASGEALIGYTRLKERRLFHCHGDCIQIAQHLEKYATNGQILIDETTYRTTLQFNNCFVPARIRSDGGWSSSVFYQWEDEK